MKRFRIIAISLVMAALIIPGLLAQSSGASTQRTNSLGLNSLKGMSLNGATGLYSIPSGRVGWDQSRDVGLDLGYHAIIGDGKATHLPKASVSLFKLVELSAAFDFQPDKYITPDKGTDFIGGLKVQLPFTTNTAIAVGGNFQGLNMANTGNYRYNAGQVYAAVTYAGQFFNMPAETTAVFGKTFKEHHSDWNIDFGMGFDIIFFPKFFGRFIHWITDFANFSYSVEAFGADSWNRGVLNTGLRIDLSALPALNKFKFVVDVLMTDAFDDNRAFSIGVVFGVPIL